MEKTVKNTNNLDNYEFLFEIIENIPPQLNTYSEFISIQEFKILFKKLNMPLDGMDDRFLFSLCYNGFFPMESGNNILPKLHQTRCCIEIEKWKNEYDLNISKDEKKIRIVKKKIKKASKKILKEIENNEYQYFIEINTNAKEIYDFTKSYHKWNFWLKKNFSEKLIDLSKKTLTFKNCKFGSCFISLIKKNTKNDKKIILATDIGYITGLIYTSMTGSFNKKFSSFGNILLFILPYILNMNKIQLWDFGMIMNYKIEVGGNKFPRNDFLKLVKKLRKNHIDMKNFAGIYKLEKITDFWNLLINIKNLKIKHKNKVKEIKLSKKLNNDMRKIEKNIDCNKWDSVFVKNWLKIKFGVNLPNEYFCQNFFDIKNKFFHEISKKKKKKIFKIIRKLNKEK